MALILILCALSACGDSNQNTADIEEEIISEWQLTEETESKQNTVDIKKEIIGEWQLTKESEDVDQGDFYPEVNYLIFSEDGTWNNKASNTYIINGESITMDNRNWFHQYTYNISITDNVLLLQYPGAEALYFTKVQ